jgi:hypothetical protein
LIDALHILDNLVPIGKRLGSLQISSPLAFTEGLFYFYKRRILEVYVVLEI